jgi:protein involved in polysaccharide export with SLBB domain
MAAELRRGIAAVFAVLCLISGAPAATASAGAEEPAVAASSVTASDVVSAGDKLNIRVFREPELSAEWNEGGGSGILVDASGNISFPLIGTFYAQGLSLEQLRLKLIDGLREYLVDPQVTISFHEKALKRLVLIMGQVVKPGSYEFTEGMGLVALVAQAGGFSGASSEFEGRKINVTADTANVQITRLGAGGSGQPLTVDVQSIMDGKSPDIKLQPSDLVIVPSGSQSDRTAAAQTVSVLGQVNRPGNYEINDAGSLVRLISDANGFTRYAAQDRVVLTRKTSSESFTRRINVSAIMNGRAEDVPLEEGDMIYVPESEF